MHNREISRLTVLNEIVKRARIITVALEQLALSSRIECLDIDRSTHINKCMYETK